MQDAEISGAIVFGSGRPRNGVIIQPREPFDRKDLSKLQNFRDRVWYIVFCVFYGYEKLRHGDVAQQACDRKDQCFLTVTFTHLQGGMLLKYMSYQYTITDLFVSDDYHHRSHKALFLDKQGNTLSSHLLRRL